MADEPDDKDEADAADDTDASFDAKELAMIARIEKAVTKTVMAELRPLLSELAKLTPGTGQAQTDNIFPNLAGDPEQLQKEFERKVEAMRRKLADRIKVSEARFIRQIKNFTDNGY